MLLFFALAPARRTEWISWHWILGVTGLVPYAVYQIRHYLRVRKYVRQTHYRVGLHSFWMVLGTVATGVPLILPLRPGSGIYSTVDLLHIFFGFAFTLLISAHLTLVAVLTVTSADVATRARHSIRWMFAVVAAVTCAAIAAIAWRAA